MFIEVTLKYMNQRACFNTQHLAGFVSQPDGTLTLLGVDGSSADVEEDYADLAACVSIFKVAGAEARAVEDEREWRAMLDARDTPVGTEVAV